jgi:hypothetical protein
MTKNLHPTRWLRLRDRVARIDALPPGLHHVELGADDRLEVSTVARATRKR